MPPKKRKARKAISSKEKDEVLSEGEDDDQNSDIPLQSQIGRELKNWAVYLNKIGSFDGTATRTGSFISEFDRICKTANWSDSIAIKLFGLQLTHQASYAFDNFMASHPDPSFTDIKQHILTSFQLPLQQRISDLYNLKQQTSESIERFGFKFATAVIDTKTNETSAIPLFINAIRTPQIQDQLRRLTHIATLQEAIQQAILEESIYQRTTTSSTNSALTISTNDNANLSDTNLAITNHQTSTRQIQPPPPVQQFQQPSFTPQLQHTPYNNFTPSQPMKVIKCYNCGGVGHISRNCSSRSHQYSLRNNTTRSTRPTGHI